MFPELGPPSTTLNPKFPRRNKWGYVAPILIRLGQSDSKFRNAARGIGPDDFVKKQNLFSKIDFSRIDFYINFWESIFILNFENRLLCYILRIYFYIKFRESLFIFNFENRFYIKLRELIFILNLYISPKDLKTLSNILKNHQQSSTKSSKIFQKNNISSANPQRGGMWGQPDPRLREVGTAGSPGGRAPLLRICRWFVVFQMIFEDSLTIVDDFVRILERGLRYFGDISRLYQVVPEPNSKLHFLSRSSRPKLKITCCSGKAFLKTRFFKNHRDLSHELRNGRLDKLVPNFIRIGHQKADLFLLGNLGFRVGEFGSIPAQ